MKRRKVKYKVPYLNHHNTIMLLSRVGRKKNIRGNKCVLTSWLSDYPSCYEVVDYACGIIIYRSKISMKDALYHARKLIKERDVKKRAIEMLTQYGLNYPINK